MADYYAANMLNVLKNHEIFIGEFEAGSKIGVADRFTVEIPYVNVKIRIRVFMNVGSLHNAPDLIILWPAVDVGIEYSYLFRDWKLNNPQALLIVINRVKESFSQYYTGVFNMLKDANQDVIYRSCRNLINNGNQLEIYVEHTDSQISTINLALPIPVNLNNSSCRKPAYLHISHTLRSERFQINIVYPEWATHLSSISPQKLGGNSFTLEKTEERLRQIFSYLTKEIQLISNSKSYRQNFFSSLLNKNIGIPLEIDTCEFIKMSFHKEIPYKGSLEIMNILIILQPDFPKSHPQYKLRSMSSTKNSELREKKYIRVKTWDSEADIDSLSSYCVSSINDEITNFLTWLTIASL